MIMVKSSWDWRAAVTPVDPAGAHCYGAGTKPCKSPGRPMAVRGERLSNTSTTCPREGDNLGKLRLIPHRSRVLEGPYSERGLDPWYPGPPEDGSAAHQVVGGVTAHQA